MVIFHCYVNVHQRVNELFRENPMEHENKLFHYDDEMEFG